MDKETIEKVYKRVQLCLMALIGDTGHAMSYSLVPESFTVTKTEKLPGELQRFHFTAKAYREGEIKTYDETGKPRPEIISGSVVLDKNLGLARDKQGNVMIEPWRHVDLSRLKKITTLRGKTQQLLYDKLKKAEDMITKIMAECGLTSDERIELLISDIQQRIHGAKISSDEALHYTQLEDIYANLIEGVMTQDEISQDDEIKVLLTAVHKRLENFDLYFEMLRQGRLKGPFLAS